MSSRKNGPQRHAGARGKKQAREVISRPGDEEPRTIAEMKGQEVMELLDDGVSRVKQLLQPHDELAANTLAEVAADPAAPAASRVTASTRILEWAHGKPAPILSKVASLTTGNGLQIVINKYFPEEVVEVVEVEAVSELIES